MNRPRIRDPRRIPTGHCHECGHPKPGHYRARRGQGWRCSVKRVVDREANTVARCHCTSLLQRFRGSTTLRWPDRDQATA